ncbi:MAG: transposase [Magnetococcales bacterium]|nr:transposase [Magnetococcales bacterium]
MLYAKSDIEGDSFFFTLTTQDRKKILCDPINVKKLRIAFKRVMQIHPFRIDAFVLLPDHLHCILTLPQGDWEITNRWRLIKGNFTRSCDDRYKQPDPSTGYKGKRPAVWQPRFQEYQIKGTEEMISHIEYIHANPVKHGLVKSPANWTHSSFHRYVKRGVYDVGWGTVPGKLPFHPSRRPDSIG